jgi:hypothetical protein
VRLGVDGFVLRWTAGLKNEHDRFRGPRASIRPCRRLSLQPQQIAEPHPDQAQTTHLQQISSSDLRMILAAAADSMYWLMVRHEMASSGLRFHSDWLSRDRVAAAIAPSGTNATRSA